MQTNKQCTFHAGTDCVYTELVPCLRQTKINWYPTLSIRRYKHTPHNIRLTSRSTLSHQQPFPAAVRLQAGRDPRQAMATNFKIKKLASVKRKCTEQTPREKRMMYNIMGKILFL